MFLRDKQFLVCPKEELTLTPFDFATCDVANIFVPHEYNFYNHTIQIAEFQIHAMILALFASFVSPFGGFFASGFKRAIKVKVFYNKKSLRINFIIGLR